MSRHWVSDTSSTVSYSCFKMFTSFLQKATSWASCIISSSKLSIDALKLNGYWLRTDAFVVSIYWAPAMPKVVVGCLLLKAPCNKEDSLHWLMFLLWFSRLLKLPMLCSMRGEALKSRPVSWCSSIIGNCKYGSYIFGTNATFTLLKTQSYNRHIFLLKLVFWPKYILKQT